MQQATVYVIDDDTEVQTALASLLRSAGWRSVSCLSAQSFLDHLPIPGVACIVLDVDMPGMSGPNLHGRLRELGSDLPVIYLTGRGSVSIGVHAMKLGALDFLEKPVDGDLLLGLVEQACVQHRETIEQRERRSEIRKRLEALSAREREVLELVVRGRLNKQIAGDLGIAEKTVKVHRGRVMAKFGVRSLAELVHLCEELGIATHPALSQPRPRET
jgi:FixJ family two-component response regulator